MVKSSRWPSCSDPSLLRKIAPIRAERQRTPNDDRQARSGKSTILFIIAIDNLHRQLGVRDDFANGRFPGTIEFLAPRNIPRRRSTTCYSATGVHPASGSNSVIAVAVSVVVF